MANNPAFMVVVPTQPHVTLRFVDLWEENLGETLTAAAAAVTAALLLTPLRRRDRG